MTVLLILLAIFVGLTTMGAWRTMATLTFTIYATVLLVLGFTVGGLWSFVAFPEAVRHWTISQSWVTLIVDSPSTNLLQLLSIPFVFIADVYRWMFEITFFQGNPFLWITMGLAVWKIVRDAKRAIKSFRAGRQEMIDLRIAVTRGTNNQGDSSSLEPIAEVTLDPGYDAAGNFVGFKNRHDAMRHGFY